MNTGKSRAYFLILACLSAVSGESATLTLKTSAAAPVAVGVPVRWEAATSEASGEVWYRYRLRKPYDLNFRTVRDYSPDPKFECFPISEGTYEVEVTSRDSQTGELQISLERFLVISRVVSGQPVITPTANELVYLYSAPACPAGGRLHVTFTSPDGVSQSTPAQVCAGDRSINVYLAGLRPETAYTVRHSVQLGGAVEQGPELILHTGPLRRSFAETSVIREPQRASASGLLFQNRVFEPSVATDLQGNVVWYYSQLVPYLTRPEPGGYLFAMLERHGGAEHEQILRQIDLAGNTVWETNAARINQQLAAQGKHSVTSFHHEARGLPDGRILVLAATERLLTDKQGAGKVDVIGDTILVLNPDLQLVWSWDAFDHLDVSRAALQDQKCTVGAGGCAVFRLAAVANDWVHGNSVALAPDGNLLYSARHQDWVYKIDYANGTGTGAVIWRLGRGGDFQLVGESEDAWFSHQHDANYVPCELGLCVLLFDNGNMRRLADETTQSRGQLFFLDETAHTARLLLNVSLGDYALALGSAQLLENGNFHFNVGWDTQGGRGQALEFDREGNLVRKLVTSTQVYRSQRMHDMYRP